MQVSVVSFYKNKIAPLFASVGLPPLFYFVHLQNSHFLGNQQNQTLGVKTVLKNCRLFVEILPSLVQRMLAVTRRIAVQLVFS